MNHCTLPILATIAAAMLLCAGCSLDPDRKLNNAVERYLEDKPGSLQKLEAEFIRNISHDSIRKKQLHSNGRFLFRTDEDEIEIVYPFEMTLSMPGGKVVRHFDVSDDYAAASDGIRISIFDSDGDHIIDETAGDTTSPVRSVLVRSGSILYYRNSILFRYDIVRNISAQLLRETFPPPYAKYYDVSMHTRNDMLYIVAGIAGSYNFSIVDLSDEKIILKDLGLSSSKHVIAGDSVFYIKGSSGSWELIKYNTAAKSKQTIAFFNSIIDIELTDDGYILENNRGLWVSEYGGEKKRLPFAYQLAGTCRGLLLVRYRNTYYLINTQRLFDVIRKLEGKVPGIFKPGDNKAASAIVTPGR